MRNAHARECHPDSPRDRRGRYVAAATESRFHARGSGSTAEDAILSRTRIDQVAWRTAGGERGMPDRTRRGQPRDFRRRRSRALLRANRTMDINPIHLRTADVHMELTKNCARCTIRRSLSYHFPIVITISIPLIAKYGFFLARVDRLHSKRISRYIEIRGNLSKSGRILVRPSIGNPEGKCRESCVVERDIEIYSNSSFFLSEYVCAVK